MEEWPDETQLDLEPVEQNGEGIEKQDSKLLVKVGAVIVLLAFITFSYAWLPKVGLVQLDFLQQDRMLSEEELVLRCRPAVVNIQATRTGRAGTSSQGTGFNLEPEGMIITNRHVVEEASLVEVTFSEENRFLSRDIEIIEGYDLAIVRLKGQDLPYLPQVTDSMVEVGQTVTIIGNPLGFQRVSAQGPVENYLKTKNDLLVFAVAVTIAPGSSGSPVIDEMGRLVGIIYATGTIKGEDRALAIPAIALLSHLTDTP